MAEIRETRKQWLAESLIDRQLAASLLSRWRDLKRLRTSQGYNTTPYRLIIQCSRPKSAQKQREKTEWEGEVRRAVAEVEEELKEEFDAQTDEYQRQLQLWKKKQEQRETQVSAVIVGNGKNAVAHANSLFFAEEAAFEKIVLFQRRVSPNGRRVSWVAGREAEQRRSRRAQKFRV